MQLKFPIVIVFILGLLTLQGCAQTAIREPTSSQEDAPNSIRTLGADQRFTTLASQTVAGRVRAQRLAQPAVWRCDPLHAGACGYSGVAAPLRRVPRSAAIQVEENYNKMLRHGDLFSGWPMRGLGPTRRPGLFAGMFGCKIRQDKCRKINPGNNGDV